MATTITQSVTFRASPHGVYEALMDPKQHAAFTGGRARISRKVGGRFSVFDGYATGVTLELVPDERIVQTWRASDWPAGTESRVTFSLSLRPDGGTTLTLTQTGVPANEVRSIAQGWRDYYWEPMRAHLGG